MDFYAGLREVERRRGKTDMFYLAKYIIGKHWIENGVVNKLGDDHQALGEWIWELWLTRHRRPYKTIAKVEWPRRTLKSTICTGAFPIMVLLNNPNARILIDSETSDKAEQFLAPIKQTFESPFFQYLFGDLRSKHDWTQGSITIKRDGILTQPSITCGGLNRDKTSNHYELIISDDTQTDKNSQNREQIDSCISNYKLYDNLLDPGGMVLMPCTVWNFNDLAQFVDQMKEEDAKSYRPQRIYLNKRSAYKRKPDGKLDFSQLEFPNVLTREELDFARATQGAFMFSCNYLCEPQSDETATFKKEWIKYHTKTPADFIDANIYMTIDPAGEGTFAGADYTAMVVAAITKEFDIYVLHCHRMHGTRETMFKKMMALYETYMPMKVGIETVFKQHELKNWLKAEALKNQRPIVWHDFKNKYKTKDHRIYSLQPYFEKGKVFLGENMFLLEDELIKFKPNDGSIHDDMVDALAYVVDFMSLPASSQPREFWRNPSWKENWKDPDKAPPDQSTVRAMKWEAQRKAKKVQRFRPTSMRLYA